jgi:hypothetical protein
MVRHHNVWRKYMRTLLQRLAIAATAAVVVAGATTALPGSAEARWHGGWHHHGGWGWGGFGWGFAPGFAIGFGAPYYGGYYGGPYAYGGDCVMRRHWVINRWGHRVLRWTRVCY